jgi:hypothetical protein
MGFLDRIFGNDKPTPRGRPAQANATDEKALERHRYMLETAPPETIEAARYE